MGASHRRVSVAGGSVQSMTTTKQELQVYYVDAWDDYALSLEDVQKLLDHYRLQWEIVGDGHGVLTVER